MFVVMCADERRRSRPHAVTVALALALLAFGAAAGAASADVRAFDRIDCIPREDVRFCEGAIGTRVRSFDGVPLDSNVALPAVGDANLPLVILTHSWGDQKIAFNPMRRWAALGYAVLSVSARGHGDSCGTEESRAAAPDGCSIGYTRWGDSRYEVRDLQWMSGKLADQGIVDPQRIGVHGGSYGGGISLTLATLRDKVRLADGSLIPWRSPLRRLSMKLAAAAPLAPWSDLAYSFMPNGRTLDYTAPGPFDDISPPGVAKAGWVNLLQAMGNANGWFPPPGADPTSDMQTWYTLIQAGEPYGAELSAGLGMMTAYKSAYYINTGADPAPTLIVSGFTDELFPVDEGVRWARKYPNATIAQLYFDYGHQRAQNKATDLNWMRARVEQWFAYHLKGDLTRVPRTGVEAFTQTCPFEAASGGPYRAATFDEVSPGEVRFAASISKRAISDPADPVGPEIDSLRGGTACITTSSLTQAGTATFRGPGATGAGYTLLGSPTVIADIEITPGVPPADTQLDARLFDVDRTAGRQILVARGAYRPSRSGRVVFQLHPNGWRFTPGHVPKLELLGRDAPFSRPSNAKFTIDVSNLEVRLPTAERPAGQVKAPAPPVLP
jgi:pimeloyl-ACP methyl ester carboxylesterase